jgi:glycerol 3-phosphatase-2
MAPAGALWAFARYEEIRNSLPQANFPRTAQRVSSLADLLERFDAFVLDAFGVINVGEAVIAGAAERIQELRAAGKPVLVLTNGASQERASALEKYARLGLVFDAREIVSSRDLAAANLLLQPRSWIWAAITAPGGSLQGLPGHIHPLLEDASLWSQADGFLFLGTEHWNDALQDRLCDALKQRPRPLIVANPDIVAPREQGLSLEPGYFAHDVARRTGLQPTFFGKPYPDAFDMAARRLEAATGRAITELRVAMVGDTLHTDILGGAAAGFSTVLITDHGLFRDTDIAACITASGIVPDYLAPNP